MDWPKITVITVCRNAAATLPRAMDSLRAQNYPNLEYFVLDAASTDDTLDIIKRNEDMISHWRSYKDEGAQDAYNEGIARASGEFIGLLNSDDWYESGILKAVGEAFMSDPSLDMITCEAKVWKVGASGHEVLSKHFKGKNLQLSPHGTPMPNARFFRRTLFERFGVFNVYNHAGQRMIAGDLEYLLRLSQHNLKNHVLQRVGYHYLMHEGSLTMGGDKGRERQMYEERAAIAQTYLRAGTLKPYKQRLKRWHRRGTSRAFLWRLAEKDWPAARQLAASGLRENPLSWPVECIRLALTGRYKQ